jgi:hypothetical protein
LPKNKILLFSAFVKEKRVKNKKKESIGFFIKTKLNKKHTTCFVTQGAIWYLYSKASFSIKKLISRE